jgi:hypothetical protein
VFSGGTQVGADRSPGNVNSTTVTGLSNGTAYTFQVAATNAIGTSGFSNPSAAVTPTAPVTATVPGAPTIGTASRGNASATVRWTPGTTGGSAITSYQVQVRTGTTVVRTVTGVASTATSTVVSGLTNGTAYNFRVRAVNAVGLGTLSAASNAVIPATVPTAAVIGTAASGVAGGTITATADWTPPTSTGGAAITGYVVRALRMSSTGTVLATSTFNVAATARSFEPTTTMVAGNYRFTVQARNVVGVGPQSVRSNLVAAR